ncbi:protein-export chaperone SecB [Tenacibaculum finnmarkense genomovar finnmarkense]|uniref:protein-export chaperone SecB n=1 Tax=Tenacibaculum finnmarkense TaxID=2781243 RepID=UPI001E3BDC39|nr:protein-export chaperone SecB [Tenacibaculum finnmarkense]MCD8416344.1 protein-export chaperone SecB [Tenacibaculum finnmarkense genomovar finnmarkense]MCG8185004.1 protein-export chaperone SecB [Tenacibaculum finnmarkense genomovar finnmarkense]MCG8201162.1 protein-export chaperone SecB [Tenacibaculum finnmarkense genomovar finnmarkense]MCG8211722.1 protein-export chaperone SecB [Tenacibaculum finnmarkense genomovar finnmarkense]MCG8218809.1 protein-export chaperone SecB [Tenacibaculum fin
MKIQLENWKVLKLNFTSNEEVNTKENSFDLKTGHFYPEDELDTFGIGFEIEINDKRFDLNIETVFMFKLDKNISEEFKLSNFPKINAPAIAFPYLRAYISNLTLQSGFEPIILPSINFVNLAEDKK